MTEMQRKPFKLEDVAFKDDFDKLCVLYRANKFAPNMGEDGKPIFIAMPEMGETVDVFEGPHKTGRVILLLHPNNMLYLERTAARLDITLIPWEPPQKRVG